jgi:hypothetical protein
MRGAGKSLSGGNRVALGIVCLLEIGSTPEPLNGLNIAEATDIQVSYGRFIFYVKMGALVKHLNGDCLKETPGDRLVGAKRYEP